MPELNECALCGATAPLVDGHLIPDFAVRRLRVDSPTPFFRGIDPNKRVQNGVRLRLLCSRCDNNRFSDAETSFARRIFHPFLNGECVRFEFEEADRYFIASLIWRTLAARLNGEGESDFNYASDDVATMKSVASNLRLYLNGDGMYPDEFEQHMFFTEPTASTSQAGLNAYLIMANDVQIISDEDRLYFYSVLSGVIIVSLLRVPDEALNDWRGNTIVRPGDPIFVGRQTIADGRFGRILLYAAEQLFNSKSKVSAEQSKVLEKEFVKIDKEQFARSRHGRALVQDFLNGRQKDGD